MPLRADRYYAINALLDLAGFDVISSSGKSESKPKSSPPRERGWQRNRILFKNTHGFCGSFAALLTCLALATQRGIPPSNAFFASTASICAGIASVVTAASGVSIVDQAPKQTIVMQYPIKVIPPHRDAFLRTASSLYYLCGRICWNVADAHRHSDDSTTGNALDWVSGCIALCFATKYFVPRARDVDWSNGNTYVFLVPMALGLTADALFQLPTLQCHGQTCWNADVITQQDLLWVQLSGLIVAFCFTLAFRGTLAIRRCYWYAALVVHGIVAFLVMKAMPFVKMWIMSSWTG